MRHLLPLLLSVMYMSLWLSVLVIIRRDHIAKVSHESFPFTLSLVFYLHPALANYLKLCKHGMQKRLPENSMIFQEHMYILLIIIIVTMILINMT